MIPREARVPIKTRKRFKYRTRKPVSGPAAPINQPGNFRREFPVPISSTQLPINSRNNSFGPLNGPVTQHKMRKVYTELMGRHIGTAHHETHIAQRTAIHDETETIT